VAPCSCLKRRSVRSTGAVRCTIRRDACSVAFASAAADRRAAASCCVRSGTPPGGCPEYDGTRLCDGVAGAAMLRAGRTLIPRESAHLTRLGLSDGGSRRAMCINIAAVYSASSLCDSARCGSCAKIAACESCAIGASLDTTYRSSPVPSRQTLSSGTGNRWTAQRRAAPMHICRTWGMCC
jgi:hypothetical protein